MGSFFRLNSNLEYKNLDSGTDLNNTFVRYRTTSDPVVASLLNKPADISKGEVTVDWFPADAANLHGAQVIRHTIGEWDVDYYIRARRAGNWGKWARVVKNTDLMGNTPERMAAGSVVVGSNYHKIRLQVEGGTLLAIYDDDAGTLLGSIQLAK